MIPSRLSLDRRQRWGLTLGIITAIVGGVYITLPHRQWNRLRQLQEEYQQKSQLSQTLMGMEERFNQTQQRWQQGQEQLANLEAGCCTDGQARMFFENLNTWAREANLQPISRSLSPITSLTHTQNSMIWTQSADMVLEGGFYDMMNYLNRLIDRPQTVVLNSLRISMPPGQEHYPRLSFRVVLIITPEQQEELA